MKARTPNLRTASRLLLVPPVTILPSGPGNTVAHWMAFRLFRDRPPIDRERR